MLVVDGILDNTNKKAQLPRGMIFNESIAVIGGETVAVRTKIIIMLVNIEITLESKLHKLTVNTVYKLHKRTNHFLNSRLTDVVSGIFIFGSTLRVADAEASSRRVLAMHVYSPESNSSTSFIISEKSFP